VTASTWDGTAGAELGGQSASMSAAGARKVDIVVIYDQGLESPSVEVRHASTIV
jgi:hypothetical protein